MKKIHKQHILIGTVIALFIVSGLFICITLNKPEIQERIQIGHGTTIITDNQVSTPELVVDNITPKTDNVRIENLTVGSIPSHSIAQHTDVTRELFLPALDGSDANVTLAHLDFYLVVRISDEVPTLVNFTFEVPDDFVSFVSVKAVWSSPAVAGNMYWDFGTYYASSGEAHSTHTEEPAIGATTTGGANIINVQEPANPLTLANLAKGDYVGITLYRSGGHANDTLDNVVNLLGLLFTYVADQ